MDTTWIVVADSVSAKICELPLDATSAHGAASLVYELKPKAALASGGVNDRNRFARQLAGALDGAFAARRFTRIALVLPPRLAPVVRALLHESTRAAIVAQVSLRFDEPTPVVAGVEVSAMERASRDVEHMPFPEGDTP